MASTPSSGTDPDPFRTLDGATDGSTDASEGGLAQVPPQAIAFRSRLVSAITAMALLAFIGITLLVYAGLTDSADLAVSLIVQRAGSPWLALLMEAVSVPGFMPVPALVVAGVAGGFWLSGFRTESLFSLAAGSSFVLTEVLKHLVERPRPASEAVRVVETISGYSFPSGHVLFYVTFFGFVSYAAFVLLRPGGLRTGILLVCAVLIALVGPSRVWLGHHWLSDVLASYALGFAYLVVLVRLHGRRRLRASDLGP